MIKESSDDDHDGLSGSSSGDEAAILHDLSRLRPPQKKQRREESVPFELLQQAGFDGGPSLAEASERIGEKRIKQQEAARTAAEEAKQREVEEEAEEAAARKLRQDKKQQSPADSLRQQLENKTHIVTQAQRRGEVLRAQADAALHFKFAAGQAQDVSEYAGAAHKEAASAAAARATLGSKRR